MVSVIYFNASDKYHMYGICTIRYMVERSLSLCSNISKKNLKLEKLLLA